MIEISNSMRQRLGAVLEPQTHPDADILAAYAENALPPKERHQFIEHLALCGQCREVVVLVVQLQPAAQKGMDGMGVTNSPGPRSLGSWLRGSWLLKDGFSGWTAPALRWGAVAAVLGIAAVLVIEQPWRLEPSTQARLSIPDAGHPVAGSSGSPNPDGVIPSNGAPMAPFSAANSGTASPPLPAETSKSDSANHLMAQNADKNALQEHLPREVVRRTGVSVIPLGGHKSVIEEKPEQIPPVVLASDSRRDFLNISRFNSGETGVEVENQIIAAAAPSLPSAPSSPNQTPNGDSRKALAAARTVPPLSMAAVNSSAFSTAATGEAKPAAPAGSDTLKTLRSALKIPGRVARFARIKTPNSEAFPGTGFFNAGQSDRNSPPAQIHWSVSSDGKLLKSPDAAQWREAYPEQQEMGVRFHVVATGGHDVWAGGNRMTLIHSRNGGVDWEKLKVGDAAYGDIMRISIDGGALQVQTMSGQTWSSQDGGQTWILLSQN